MVLKQKHYGYIDMITLSLRTSVLYSLIFAAKTLFEALLPTFQIFATAAFISAAISVYRQEADITAVYVPVSLLAGILIYNVLSGVLFSLIDCRRVIFYRKKLTPLMLFKRAGLEYRHIENQKSADLINRICPGFDGEVWSMYSQILMFLRIVVYITGLMVALFTQVWWISITMAAFSIPFMYIATRAGKQTYEADKEVTKIDRRADYLSSVLISREAVEERAVYGYSEELNRQYIDKYEFARKFRMKVFRKNFIKQNVGGIAGTCYSVGAVLMLLGPVTSGAIDISMFIALIGAIFGLSERLSYGFHRDMQELARRREYMRDLTEFMMLEEVADATLLPKKGMSFQKIEFKNVHFTYPGTEKPVLKGVSFTIERGGHFAFVGENGSGKTTITKLLTGLYSNYEGEILVDGRSLREMGQSEIKGLTSVVYQDFARYYISLYDNLAIASPDNIGTSESRDEVNEALKLLNLSDMAEKLPDGLDTNLGKVIENGVDISGGEWQRTAMARSIMSNAPLKILDEPTAALDPISENEVYRHFESISRGSTTIFISHRLGSTKLADTIFVLSEGTITETGTHLELMALDGLYSKMFRSQAEWYSTEVTEYA